MTQTPSPVLVASTPTGKLRHYVAGDVTACGKPIREVLGESGAQHENGWQITASCHRCRKHEARLFRNAAR